MLGINLIRKSITFLTAVAVWSVFSMTAFASPDATMGEITVSGQVAVNGQAAVSNSTITSGNNIVTGANSTATINLGKIGRVELLSDTNFTLKFSNNSIVGTLNSGKVRISNSAGIATSVTTRNATVVADAGQANVFGVDVGCADEARCTQTYAETTTGLISIRNGSNDKQVAAGADATVGNPSQTGCKPCLRPGSGTSVPVAGIGVGAIAALLLAAAGASATAIFFGNRGNDIVPPNEGIVVSATR